MAAAAKGHTTNVKHLLTKGANIDLKMSDGKTALMIAAEKGDLATVKVLVARGAGIHHQCDDGSTALTLAAGARYKYADVKVVR